MSINNEPPNIESKVNKGELPIEVAIDRLKHVDHSGHQVTAGRLAVRAAYQYPDEPNTVRSFCQQAEEYYTRASQLGGRQAVLSRFQLGQLPLYETLAQNSIPNSHTLRAAYENSIGEIHNYLREASPGRTYARLDSISFILPLQRLAAEGQYDRLVVASDYGGYPQTSSRAYEIAVLDTDPRQPEHKLRVGKTEPTKHDHENNIHIISPSIIFPSSRREASEQIVVDDEYKLLARTATFGEQQRAENRAHAFSRIIRSLQ